MDFFPYILLIPVFFLGMAINERKVAKNMNKISDIIDKNAIGEIGSITAIGQIREIVEKYY